MAIEKTVEELTRLVDGELIRGDPTVCLRRIMPTDQAEEDAVTFVTKARYLSCLPQTKARAVILAPDLLARSDLNIPGHAAIIRVQEPYVAFARAAQTFAAQVPQPVGVHPSAVIDETATLAPEVSIGPFVYVGPNAKVHRGAVLYAGVHVEAGAEVGAGSVLYNHVVIRHDCSVGAQCVLHPGVIVGSDGFGFAQEKNGTSDHTVHLKIPQIGDVRIDDDVEIGANSCIDRATLGTTKIGAGTKIDNLVQVGHNVEIGPGCVLVAQSGVAGSTRLGRGVVLAAQSGICGHVELGDGAVVGGQSGVRESLPVGADVIGSPAVPKSEFFRGVVRISKLDALFTRVRKLERLLGEKKDPCLPH